MSHDAVLRRVSELLADIMKHGTTIVSGQELKLNPSVEELDLLVSEYGLVPDAAGGYTFGKPFSPA